MNRGGKDSFSGSRKRQSVKGEASAMNTDSVSQAQKVVERALTHLARALLTHSDNAGLRAAMAKGRAVHEKFYRELWLQLLRMAFLIIARRRGLIELGAGPGPGTTPRPRRGPRAEPPGTSQKQKHPIARLLHCHILPSSTSARTFRKGCIQTWGYEPASHRCRAEDRGSCKHPSKKCSIVQPY